MGKGFEGRFKKGEGRERKPDEKPSICLMAYAASTILISDKMVKSAAHHYYYNDIYALCGYKGDISGLVKILNNSKEISIMYAHVIAEEGINLGVHLFDFMYHHLNWKFWKAMLLVEAHLHTVTSEMSDKYMPFGACKYCPVHIMRDCQKAYGKLRKRLENTKQR